MIELEVAMGFKEPPEPSPPPERVPGYDREEIREFFAKFWSVPENVEAFKAERAKTFKKMQNGWS